VAPFERIFARLVSTEGGAQRGRRNSLASQPTASDFIGSTITETFSVRSQVEHSNVRSSKPRPPGEMRPSAMRCLHAGHMGRSLIESPITRTPGDHRQGRTYCSLSKEHWDAFSSAVSIPWNGRGGSRLFYRAALKCVACAAPPPSPNKPPKAGLRTAAGADARGGAAGRLAP